MASSSQGSSALWRDREGPVRLLTSAVVGILCLYALITPFGLTPQSLIKFLTSIANGYPYLTANAFNPWALVALNNKPPLALSGVIYGFDHWSRDDVPLLGSLTGVNIGASLLVLGLLVGVARLIWRADHRSILIVGAYLSMCFFMLPTRVHERYLFSALAFCPLLAAVNRNWLVATLALSVGIVMNLHASLSDAVPLPFGTLFQSPAGILTSVLLHIGVFLFAILSLRLQAEPIPIDLTASVTARNARDNGPTDWASTKSSSE